MKKITIRNSGQLGLWGDFQNTDLDITNTDGGRSYSFDDETTQCFLQQTQNNYRLASNDADYLPQTPTKSNFNIA